MADVTFYGSGAVAPSAEVELLGLGDTDGYGAEVAFGLAKGLVINDPPVPVLTNTPVENTDS